MIAGTLELTDGRDGLRFEATLPPDDDHAVLDGGYGSRRGQWAGAWRVAGFQNAAASFRRTECRNRRARARKSRASQSESYDKRCCLKSEHCDPTKLRRLQCRATGRPAGPGTVLPMAVSLTVIELAAAMRLGDGATAPTAPLDAILARLLGRWAPSRLN